MMIDTNSLKADFKAAMRQLAATVTIISTVSAGRRLGMSATAVTSLSDDPVSLLICVNQLASIHPNLVLGRLFCINILGQSHVDLAAAFGGKVTADLRFSHGDWLSDAHDVPYLSDAQATIFCSVDQLANYGTHSIVIGKVYAAQAHAPGQPLVYASGGFIKLNDAS